MGDSIDPTGSDGPQAPRNGMSETGASAAADASYPPEPGAQNPTNEPDPTPTADPAPAHPRRDGARRNSRLRAAIGFVGRNAYLMLIAGAFLVVTRTVEFAPPPEVRVGKANVAQLVGDAPPQDFSSDLTNPQAIQVRATVRLYPDSEMTVSVPDPQMDAQGKMLSQPVVTTILGMNATVDQTIRLEDGNLEIDLVLNATPRLAHKPRRGKPAPPIILENEIVVKSRRSDWWRTRPRRRVHLDSRSFLNKVEDEGYRIVFTVDGHLFSLDLELHRAFSPLAESTMAKTRRN